ncbi:MAG: response regulator [Desulfobacterales bacterium]
MGCQHISSIMVAEDDPDDRFLIQNAFEEITRSHSVNFVKNGEELLGYLDQTHKADPALLPALIILDLNMPKISGHEVLEKLKKNTAFNAIDIVVLTTSCEESDIEFCRLHGVNSFFTKPDTYEKLVQILKLIIL